MSKRICCNDSAAFGANVALAAVKGDEMLADQSKRFEVHPNQIAQWKDQLVSGAANAFSGETKAAPPPADIGALLWVRCQEPSQRAHTFAVQAAGRAVSQTRGPDNVIYGLCGTEDRADTPPSFSNDSARRRARAPSTC